jgi:hypothetical protein
VISARVEPEELGPDALLKLEKWGELLYSSPWGFSGNFNAPAGLGLGFLFLSRFVLL